MDSIPLAAWMPAFDAGDYAGVARFMVDSAHALAKAGADFAICPDNSAHLAWDHVQLETPIPWLHIARVLAEEARTPRLSPGRPARHPVHDGRAALPRHPRGDGHRDGRAGGRRLRHRRPHHLLRARGRHLHRRLASRLQRRDRAASASAAATRSRWRARRSRCWCVRRSCRCRRSTPPGSSPRPRCAKRWPDFRRCSAGQLSEALARRSRARTVRAMDGRVGSTPG